MVVLVDVVVVDGIEEVVVVDAVVEEVDGLVVEADDEATGSVLELSAAASAAGGDDSLLHAPRSTAADAKPTRVRPSQSAR